MPELLLPEAPVPPVAPLLLGVLLLPALPLAPPEDDVSLELELGVELDEPLLGVLVDELPPVAPLAPEPDLLKYASHSVREIWPSLLVSTLVKLGASVEAPPLDDMPELPPLAALPPLELELGVELDELLGEVVDELPLEVPAEPDAPDELLPVALGDDEEPAEPVLLLWARVTLDSANSAAAVAVVINFNFIGSFLL